MKVVRTDRRGRIELAEVPAPTPRPGQIGIASACSLISPGTELHYARAGGGEGWLQLGYCAAGHVEAPGEGAEGPRAGEAVIAMGWGYAVHAERIAVPRRLVVPLRSATPLRFAVFAGLAATSLHALDRARPLGPGARILVVGAGLVGQLAARLAALESDSVFVTDALEGRLEAARRAGLKAFRAGPDAAGAIAELTRGRGVDVILLCTAGDHGFPRELCLGALARAPDGNRRGVIVCVGRFPLALDVGAELGNVDVRVASRCGTGYRDDAYAHGDVTYAAPPGEGTVDANLSTCLRHIEAGRLDVSALVSHVVPFARAPEAYAHFADPARALGVVLEHAS